MRKTIITAIAICIALHICQRCGLTNILTDIELMQNLFESLGILGYLVFILLAVVVSVLVLPGQFLAIVAGITYGGFIGGLLTVVGATMGSYLSFVLGRYLARDYVVNKFGNTSIFKKIELGVNENGISFLILTRLMPIFPYALQSYAYALTPMSAKTFTFVSFFTMIPASFVYAYMASEIVVSGFSLKLLIEFAIAGILLFIISFIPKAIAKKKHIQFDI